MKAVSQKTWIVMLSVFAAAMLIVFIADAMFGLYMVKLSGGIIRQQTDSIVVLNNKTERLQVEIKVRKRMNDIDSVMLNYWINIFDSVVHESNDPLRLYPPDIIMVCEYRDSCYRAIYPGFKRGRPAGLSYNQQVFWVDATFSKNLLDKHE